MEKHHDLGQRIRQAIDSTGKKQVEFAKELGVEPSHLNRWVKGAVAPSYDVLAKIGNLTGVSLDKIISGKEPAVVATKRGELAYIPLYDIRAAAGGGALIEAEEVKDFLAFKQHWIRDVLRVNPNDLRLIYVDGDSMEPTLHHGDIILVNIGNHSVVRDGVYVVRIGMAVMVKRLQILPGDKLKVKSDNSEVYESFMIDLAKVGEDVTIIGRVVWAGRGL